MFRSITRPCLCCTILCLLVVTNVCAEVLPVLVQGNPTIYGGRTGLNKAVSDTIQLMGPTSSGAAFLGDFKAGWNGWTSVDNTQPTESHWQVSSYNQTTTGNLAAWCGDLNFPSCDGSLDIAGGYGNNWHDLLSYRVAVTNPGAAATVGVSATLQFDTESGYDYVFLSAVTKDTPGFTDLNQWTGTGVATFSDSTSYLPGEYVGGTDIQIVFRFQSDNTWSDEDCQFTSAGACQLDDVQITVSQAGQPTMGSFSDFQDGSLSPWQTILPVGVGDFAKLWRNLEDVDPCQSNYSQQVAFIDDGLVVPGTGGAECINWCYGPSGYIVNTTGGLAGPSAHLNNEVLSPVMTWPEAAANGAELAFDVYRQEDLTSDSPGIFYVWGIRSADTDNSAGNGVQILSEQPFTNEGFLGWGAPTYLRESLDVTGLLNAGRDEVQISLGVLELGFQFGWNGDDGFPAPYFDNVSLKAYPTVGPGMSAKPQNLAQDNFPETDVIDAANPGTMHVRFDMAANIASWSALRNDPGDSIVATIAVLREGATLAGPPQLHYVISANPDFDAFRTTPVSGMVHGIPAVGPSGPGPDQWAFDLPDTGTLFPGDVLHYYIRASDDLAGDIQSATLPADITGFGDFGTPLAYDRNFVVQALPSLHDDHSGGFYGPDILFWNDAAGRAGDNEWYGAFNNLSLKAGLDYDIYSTNQPSSGLGNGIGGRTGGAALAPYKVLIYSSGDLNIYTISDGDFNRDPGDDLSALQTWLSGGDKGLFLTGDGLVSDLVSNTDGTFASDVMGVDPIGSNLRPFIANQTAPRVIPTVANTVFYSVDTWLAYGGCSSINTFDAVRARPDAVPLAEFADQNGNTGSYDFAAATLHVFGANNKVVSMPYDLSFIFNDSGAKSMAPLPARAYILRDVIFYLGYWAIIYDPVNVPALGEHFAVANAPNPFNPRTAIEYTIDAPGHLTVKIFNVRGQLVRTLLDEKVETSGRVIWDGSDDTGQQLASGVYFREARLGQKVSVGKMLLVK